MATQTVIARAATGRTVTGKLFSGVASDTVVQSVSGTELTNDKGSYSFAFTDVPAGEYRLTIFDDVLSIPIANWRTKLDLATGTYDVYGKADTRDIAASALDIQSRIPAALDAGRIVATVGAYQTGLAPPTAGAIADAVLDEPVDEHTTAGSVGGWIAAVSASLTLLMTRISSGVAAMFGDLIQMIANSGTANAQFTIKALENVATGAGAGARTVTITVTLASEPVEGAIVRLKKSAEEYTATTNVSGVAVFNVDDGTWVVSITAANASFAGASLVVDGTETVSYALTTTSLTPSSPSLITGYWFCYSAAGVIQSGVTVTMNATKVPANKGFALASATRTATSGVDGIAQFANLIPGATYSVKRGSGETYSIKIPEDATGTIELNSIIGT